MSGLNTLEFTDTPSVYAFLAPWIEDCSGEVMCYSRLPMRQLLRYIPSNKVEMWWISDHDDLRSIPPDVNALEQHVKLQFGTDDGLLIVEGVDWLAARSGEAPTLAWLQRLDALSRELNLSVILPVDPLSLSVHFWRRLSGLAPAIDTSSIDENEAMADGPGMASAVVPALVPEERAAEVDEVVLTHLVSLPLPGFTKTLLGKRMLQWKRMGFDLSALEPALSMKDMSEVHAIYAAVEADIILAIDGLRLMEHHQGRLSVSEREMFNYRMMSLNDVRHHVHELERTISSR